jgi:hypothetical protein
MAAASLATGAGGGGGGGGGGGEAALAALAASTDAKVRHGTSAAGGAPTLPRPTLPRPTHPFPLVKFHLASLGVDQDLGPEQHVRAAAGGATGPTVDGGGHAAAVGPLQRARETGAAARGPHHRRGRRASHGPGRCGAFGSGQDRHQGGRPGVCEQDRRSSFGGPWWFMEVHRPDWCCASHPRARPPPPLFFFLCVCVCVSSFCFFLFFLLLVRSSCDRCTRGRRSSRRC